jgi:trehalose-phosphatase
MKNIDQALHLLDSDAHMFIALDRDGTLVPYTARPDEAIMPESTRQIIADLAGLPGVSVAIVSARGVRRLQEDLLDSRVILAGNYGLEIRFADGSEEINPQAKAAAPLLSKVRQRLSEQLKGVSNTILEDDIYSLCLHWHLVPPSERKYLHEILSNFNNELDSTIAMITLPTSYEFMPNITWNKGHAMARIASQLSLAPGACLNVYIGDTETDEPAIIWVNCNGGISIRVGSNIATNAQYILANTGNVANFLKEVVKRRQAS